jgi:serine/threonine-protein kinase HipA
MQLIQTLKVFLKFSHEEILVGELVTDKGVVYFRYSKDFLNSGYELSPYKLPLSEETFQADKIPFEGLFGVFDDSLPDGWGRLLLDKKLLKQGVLPQEIGPLDRLAHVGENGSGALIYRPFYEKTPLSQNKLDLDIIAKNSLEVYEGTSEEIVDNLYSLGGSSGGARPKIEVGYNPETKKIISDQKQLPDGYEHWIIKFPSSIDLPDIANVEYAYYLMARDAGIEISDSLLLAGDSDKNYFATKRFDRIKNDRLHKISAAGLLNDNFRMSTLDYGHLMDAGFKLERDVKVYEKVLRLAAFNIFTHNRDDHSKNFSFLMDNKGAWQFAPAYDLTFSTSSHGMHSTTIAGAGDNPGIKHLQELASEFGVKNLPQIIEQVTSVTEKWKKYAAKSGVTEDTTTVIQHRLIKIK